MGFQLGQRTLNQTTQRWVVDGHSYGTWDSQACGRAKSAELNSKPQVVADAADGNGGWTWLPKLRHGVHGIRARGGEKSEGVYEQATEAMPNMADRASDMWDKAYDRGAHYYRNADGGTLGAVIAAGLVGYALAYLIHGYEPASGRVRDRRLAIMVATHTAANIVRRSGLDGGGNRRPVSRIDEVALAALNVASPMVDGEA